MRTTSNRWLARKTPASACPVRRRLGGLYAPELLEARIAPATFIVTSLLDNGDGAKLTLREAIEASNDPVLHPGPDTITFKIPAAELPGTIVLDTGTGQLVITGPLTITGPGPDLLSISGSDTIRIFGIGDGLVATLSPTVLSGLTLTDGKTATSGGALFSSEPLTLKNVVVRSSYAGVNGGGVFVFTPGKISVVGSRFVHNGAGKEGGGASLDGDAGVTVVRSTFADNDAGTSGGLSSRAVGTKAAIVLDTCIVSNNTADATGGVRLFGAGDGQSKIKNSLITGNNGGDKAGGLFLDNGNLAITNTTFANNSAKAGGAIVDDADRSLTIAGSLFLGNRATDGAGLGGGALQFEGLTIVKIAGTVFSGNLSARMGGAIANHGAGLALSIAGSSFLGNSAGFDAGAISLTDGAVLTVKSSLFNGNIASSVGGAITGNFTSVLNLSGSKFIGNRSANGGAIFITGAGVNGVTANLSGNLFQANFSSGNGGAITATDNSHFTSKADKFIGNVAAGQGGGVDLVNTGGISITGSLFQSNVAGSSGGGADIGGAATLTGLKVFENISGSGGKGGGLRLSGGPIVISKSIITGNVANDGGGIFFNLGTTTLDPATIAKTLGNAALINPNIGSA